MKLKIMLAALFIGTIVVAGISARKQDAFAAAEDFPRGALVYVQVSDLPALLKELKTSETAAKYLQSQNFSDFKNNHLGRKLAARLQEFDDGAGFPFDLETISGFAQNRASVALYDVGKLEFIFISPVSDEIFAATMLMQNPGRFTSEEYEGGVNVYRVAIDADRGRQKQQLLFTCVKGRLVIATSEKLLARAVSNISGRSRNDRLADDPAFRRLRDKVQPGLFTVWLDQAALNSDYYFKRYWLMGDVADLRNYKAAMCDFSVEEGRMIERREFLLNAPAEKSDLDPRDVAALLSHLPDNIPYYRLAEANPKALNIAIGQTIDRTRSYEGNIPRIKTLDYSPDNYEYQDSDYSSLSSRFDAAINEEPDDTPAAVTTDAPDDLSPLLLPARPRNILTFTRPEMLPAPLFVEFRRGAVFRLGSPGSFDRDRFEAAIAQKLLSRVTVAPPDGKSEWTTKTENDSTWRQFDLPMLGWEICYTLRGNELFLANNADFLREMLAAKKAEPSETQARPVSERAVLFVPGASKVFDPLFAKLAETDLAKDFFTGNIKSLFESIPNVQKIEFERGSSGDMVHEKIVISTK